MSGRKYLIHAALITLAVLLRRAANDESLDAAALSRVLRGVDPITGEES